MELRARFASALASGALEPIPTELHEVPDRGVRFGVRVVSGDDRKRGEAARPASGNPFLPFEQALHVADLSPRHVCLLNKFPVFRDHALIVTRDFEEQTAPLGAGDFEALWGALGELGGVGFYNAGEIAGASQRHRHLQVVPPLLRGPRATPIDALLDDARFDAPVGRAPGLPFLHAVARLRSCQRQAPTEAARALLGLYREMARAFGCDRAERPYNLLVTREWMLLVPRSREKWQGISLNGLAFAGAILVRNAEQLAHVREAGPMTLLTRGGVASGAERTHRL
jgi:ATP adenylyltransferase